MNRFGNAKNSAILNMVNLGICEVLAVRTFYDNLNKATNLLIWMKNGRAFISRHPI